MAKGFKSKPPFDPFLVRDKREYTRHYESNAERRADQAFYKTKAWRNLRAVKLSLDPLCQTCQKRASEHVHHIVPRKTAPELALELSNLSALCIPCHTRQEKKKSKDEHTTINVPAIPVNGNARSDSEDASGP